MISLLEREGNEPSDEPAHGKYDERDITYGLEARGIGAHLGQLEPKVGRIVKYEHQSTDTNEIA